MKSKSGSRVVLFDLDKTLLKSNSSFHFGTFLYQRNYLSSFKMVGLLATYFCHKLGFLSIRSLHERVFQSLFLGKCQQELAKLADTFLEGYLEKMLYLPAYNRLEKAKEREDYTVICSSAPCFLVEKIAKKFEVDEWVATRYGVNEQFQFHSLSEIIEGKEKAQFALALSKRLDVPLAAITAYSDSRHDLPFLEAVGEKIGVNPDRVLKRACLKNNWEII